jgi:hypothetical protein
MQFKTVQKFTQSVIDSIQNSAVASVKSLKSHLFDVKVSNFPKDQTVSGKVSITNQAEISSEVKKLKKILLEFQNSVNKKKFPKSFEVSNFPDFPKPESFPKSLEVSNFPQKIRIANTKDLASVKVKNQPTKELADLSNQVEALGKLIKAIKLDPKINVAPAEIPPINIPEPKVEITQEFDPEEFSAIITQALYSKDPKEYLSVRLSNGEKFYEAISELVTLSSSGSSSSFRDADGNPQRALINSDGKVEIAQEKELEWEINDILPDSGDSTITYICQEAGVDWRIKKIEKDGDHNIYRYASAANNSDIDGYIDAYNNRESLTYTIKSLS